MSLNYVYRYDDLISHRCLYGGALRAKQWYSDGGFYHAPLAKAERDMPKGHGVFRISFWKTERDLWKHAGSWSLGMMSPPVLQRIRADHPFFRAYTRVQDDRAEEAWLYWKTTAAVPDQRWSDDGIGTADIEIVDLDGEWRPMRGSSLMAPMNSQLSRAGFRCYLLSQAGYSDQNVLARVVDIEHKDDLYRFVLLSHGSFRFRTMLSLQQDDFIEAVVNAELECHERRTVAQKFFVAVYDELEPALHDSQRFVIVRPVHEEKVQPEAVGWMFRLWRRSNSPESIRMTVDQNAQIGIRADSEPWATMLRQSGYPLSKEIGKRLQEIIRSRRAYFDRP